MTFYVYHCSLGTFDGIKVDAEARSRGSEDCPLKLKRPIRVYYIFSAGSSSQVKREHGLYIKLLLQSPLPIIIVAHKN